MAVYKDTKRNTWYVKYSVLDADTGKRKQAMKRGFPTKRAALEFESTQRLTPVTINGITFEKLAENYFRFGNQKDSTKSAQMAILYTHIPFMKKRVEELSKNDLMEWYLELDSKELKPSMKNLILTITKSVFKYGEDFHDLKNPSRMLKKFRDEKTEMKVWTPEQFDQFIKCVKLNHYRNLFTFIYMTGCRKSEAINLRYDDIVGNRCHIRGTKTKASDRYITLPDALTRILSPVLEQRCERSPFVFGGDVPLNIGTARDIFKASTKKAGLPKIRIHDLRHSFATNAIAAGCNIVAVSKYLGHSNINTTLTVYAHLLQKTESEMIEKINKMYQNSITLA